MMTCTFHTGAKLAAWSANGFPQLGDKGGAGLGKTTKKVLNHKAFATDPHTAAYEVWDDAGTSTLHCLQTPCNPSKRENNTGLLVCWCAGVLVCLCAGVLTRF